jgi:MFS family permease
MRRALRSAALLGPPFAAVLLLFAARGFYLPTLPLIIASSTGSYAVVGLAGAASTLAQLASQYALGALSDAVGRGAVAALGFALLAAFLHGLRSASSALQFVGLRALEGVASAAVYTSAAAAVGDAASALGVKVGLATGVARMLGSASFATASLLSRGFSASSVLQLALLVCVAAAPLSLAVRGRGARSPRPPAGPVEHARLLAASAAWSAAFMAVTSVWPNYMVSAGYSSDDVYLLWAVAAYGEVPFMVLGGHLADRGRAVEAFAASSAALAATFAVYAAAPRWDLLLAAQLLRSLAFALFESSTLAYANLLADPAARGRFVGLRNTAVAAGWAAGSALGGFAADFVGLKALIAACSAILAALAAASAKLR